MTVRVALAIQAHPARAHLAEPLADCLGADVVYDPDPDGYPSPWRTYRHALEQTPAAATHRLIVQDDVTTCCRFPEAVAAALTARPDAAVTFFHSGQPMEHLPRLRAALAAGEPWVELASYRWAPAIALAIPARLIEPILAYVDEQGWPVEFRADDEILGRALTALNEPLHVTVPSLVQHPDLVMSLVRPPSFTPGVDPDRRAFAYIGDDADPARITW